MDRAERVPPFLDVYNCWWDSLRSAHPTLLVGPPYAFDRATASFCGRGYLPPRIEPGEQVAEDLFFFGLAKDLVVQSLVQVERFVS
jgi:hypothetical protein